MKKVLVAAFLSLLLVGCATPYGGAGNISHKDENRIVLGFTDALFVGVDAMTNGSHVNNNIAAVHCKSHGKFAYYFDLSYNEGGGPGEFVCSKKYLASHPEYGGKLLWTNFNKSSNIYVESEKIELASMIDDAKSTCEDLGFTEGTDKFADCSLKLYSQSVELAAKNNQQVVQSGMSGGVVTIYDPVRDSNALMDKGMKMITGRCTLGYNC